MKFMTKKLFNKLLVLVSFVCLAFIVVACTKVEEVFIMGPSSVEVGSVIDLEATISPESAQGKKVTWTVDDDTIATIDKDGKLTGVKAGKVVVTATAQKKEGTKEVTVVAPVVSPTSVAVNGDDEVLIGSTITLTAVPTPSGSYAATVWTSSNANIATVNSSGVVTGVAKGNVTISAKIGNTTGTKSIEVKEVEVVYDVPTSVAITGAKDVEVGKTLTLGITITPSQGNYPATLWSSSDDTVASVSTTGVVSGVSAGKVTISVDVNGVKDEVEINVVAEQQAPTKVTVNGSNTVEVGKTISLSATADPAGTYGATTWDSSDSSIATVNATGVVTGVKAGKVTISATIGGVVGEREITVFAQKPSSISISGPEEITVGIPTQFTVVYNPANAGGDILWSVDDESVAEVDGYGVVTAFKGSNGFELTADYGEGIFDVIWIDTVWASIEDIIIIGDELLIVGEQYQYEYEIVPFNANPSMYWTVDKPAVATIDVMTGLVTPLTAGSLEIRVNATGFTGKLPVEVVLPEVTSISIVGPNEVEMDKTYSYSATINPEHASKDVLWSSSNTTVATIDEYGVLTVKVWGTVIITATSVNGLTDTLELVIDEPEVEIQFVGSTEGMVLDYSGLTKYYVNTTYSTTGLTTNITYASPWWGTWWYIIWLKWDSEVGAYVITGRRVANTAIVVPDEYDFAIGAHDTAAGDHRATYTLLNSISSNPDSIGRYMMFNGDPMVSGQTDLEFYFFTSVDGVNTIYETAEFADYEVISYMMSNIMDTDGITLPILTREGYNFLGWCKKMDLSDEPVLTAKYENYVTRYFASWEALVKNVKFMVNGALYHEYPNVEYGGTVTKPANPTVTGYTFVEWYTDAGLTEEWDPNEEIFNDLVIYAKMNIIIYTIEYFNGEERVYFEREDYKVTDAFVLPIVEEDGYYFVGWFDTDDFSGTAIWDIKVGTIGDLKLYACLLEDDLYSLLTLELDGGALDWIVDVVGNSPVESAGKGWPATNVNSNLDVIFAYDLWHYLSGRNLIVSGDTWAFWNTCLTNITRDPRLPWAGNATTEAGRLYYTHFWDSLIVVIDNVLYEPVGGFFGTEPYKTKYADVFAIVCQLVQLRMTSTNNMPTANGKGNFAYTLDAYFYGNQSIAVNAVQAQVTALRTTMAIAGEVGDGYVLYLPLPTKVGYVFGGWYDNDEFTGASYRLVSGLIDTYYAKWIPIV